MAESSDKKDYVIGVDLGGTKILAGVFNLQLECKGRARVSTKADRDAKEVIERIARCVKDAVDECDLEFKQIKAVGIGAPGAVNPETGRSSSRPTSAGKMCR
jgi:glucokinase